MSSPANGNARLLTVTSLAMPFATTLSSEYHAFFPPNALFHAAALPRPLFISEPLHSLFVYVCHSFATRMRRCCLLSRRYVDIFTQTPVARTIFRIRAVLYLSPTMLIYFYATPPTSPAMRPIDACAHAPFHVCRTLATFDTPVAAPRFVCFVAWLRHAATAAFFIFCPCRPAHASLSPCRANVLRSYARHTHLLSRSCLIACCPMVPSFFPN